MPDYHPCPHCWGNVPASVFQEQIACPTCKRPLHTPHCRARQSHTILNKLEQAALFVRRGDYALAAEVYSALIDTDPLCIETFAGCIRAVSHNLSPNPNPTADNLFAKAMERFGLPLLSFADPELRAWADGRGLIRDTDTAAYEGGTLLRVDPCVKVFTVREGTSRIDARAFSECTGLERVTLPITVEEIGNYAFFGCTALREVTFSEGVTAFSAHMFQGCTALRRVVMPASVCVIGDAALHGCSSLSELHISAGVTSIGKDAFFECPALTSIVVDEGNTHYHASGNCLIETVGKTLIQGCNTSVIPDTGVEIIRKFAFAFQKALADITLPEGLLKIEENAFYMCQSLKHVTIPASVTEIARAFVGCDEEFSVTFAGTRAQWEEVKKDTSILRFTVICRDDPPKTSGETPPETPPETPAAPVVLALPAAADGQDAPLDATDPSDPA